MAGNVRRFANLHSFAIVVTADLPEPDVVLEAQDRRAHGRDTLPKSRSSIGSFSLRYTDPYKASQSFWR